LVINQCALTGRTGKFVKSHLLPKALTRPEEPGLPLIQSGSGKKVIIRRDSWYDKSLVTADGEAILADLDDWAIKFLRQSKLVWSGWGPQQSIGKLHTPLLGTPNGIRIIDICKPELLRLFFLSLLWRAAATDRPEFSEIKLPKDDLYKLGGMLVEGSSKPFDFYPISLVQISTRGPQHNQTPIVAIKKIPNLENGQFTQLRVFRFYLDGLVIHMDCELLEGGGNGSKNLSIVGGNKKLRISTVGYNASFQRKNLLAVLGESKGWPRGFMPPQV